MSQTPPGDERQTERGPAVPKTVEDLRPHIMATTARPQGERPENQRQQVDTWPQVCALSQHQTSTQVTTDTQKKGTRQSGLSLRVATPI